jgi:hypothetical protein
MQTADDAADDEKQQRNQHASRTTADCIECARAAAIGELHTDAEHECANDEGWSDGSNGPAETGQPRRHRDYDDCRQGNQQQDRQQTAGLSMQEKAAP